MAPPEGTVPNETGVSDAPRGAAPIAAEAGARERVTRARRRWVAVPRSLPTLAEGQFHLSAKLT